jgi:hypothetical protein
MERKESANASILGNVETQAEKLKMQSKHANDFLDGLETRDTINK